MEITCLLKPTQAVDIDCEVLESEKDVSFTSFFRLTHSARDRRSSR